MLLIVSIILCLYVFLITRYTFGWNKTKNISIKNFFPKVSVVIAIRNEEKRIAQLFKSLEAQIYPTDKLEFILVNDHSTDHTSTLLNKFNSGNFQILNMSEDELGKKHAISMGVSIAIGEIILVSDADCSFGPNWVQSMISYFANDDVKLISGPVFLNKKEGIFQNLQALEFASLVGSGAGAIGVNNAIFCNGANMAYRKEVFLEVNDFKKYSIASGDDVFLLHNVKAKYPNSIVFAKNEDAIVMTNGAQTINDFINQRKRWTAKSSEYKDIASVYVAYLVALTNISFIFLFATLFFDNSFLQFFGLFYVIKFFVDFFLLYPTLEFFNRTDLIKWIFPFELFYSFYIISILILSFAKKFEWKGRTYKK